MCFSAAADFTAAALTAPVGVVALRWAPTRRDLPIAALPMLFAVHQAVEGVVWLGFDGGLSGTTQRVAIVAYLAIAQIVLPLLVPLGVFAIEPPGWRRRALALPIAAGVAIAVWVTYVLLTRHIGAYVGRHAIVYDTDTSISMTVALLYGFATVGAVVLTSHRRLLILGAVNLVGFVGAALVRYEAVTSVWCVYAALTSAVVLLHLDARRKQVPAAERPRRDDPIAA